MKNLEKLYLDGMGISDLSPLSALKNLHELHLCDIQTVNGLSMLIPQVPYFNITDLVLLAGLKNRLPNCKIIVRR